MHIAEKAAEASVLALSLPFPYHSETKQGTPGVSRQVGDTQKRNSKTDRFTADTAAKTGESKRDDSHGGQKAGQHARGQAGR